MGLMISNLGLNKWIIKFNAGVNGYCGSWLTEGDAYYISFLLFLPLFLLLMVWQVLSQDLG